MLIKNRLTLAVSAALGLGTAALLPAVANAQDEQLIEEVVITGSRICLLYTSDAADDSVLV